MLVLPSDFQARKSPGKTFTGTPRFWYRATLFRRISPPDNLPVTAKTRSCVVGLTPQPPFATYLLNSSPKHQSALNPPSPPPFPFRTVLDGSLDGGRNRIWPLRSSNVKKSHLSLVRAGRPPLPRRAGSRISPSPCFRRSAAGDVFCVTTGLRRRSRCCHRCESRPPPLRVPAAIATNTKPET
ncbi:hypothetical protein PIB30_090778 [Stylosanthes scabra]|uniref:Uncharacterized protein n=1 Tax=Stylosanthes scabra TaxID=79078 RepID=A0ABU6TTU4_9FABA|nr:hypothetical protein [Stylosanthes scabra]